MCLFFVFNPLYSVALLVALVRVLLEEEEEKPSWSLAPPWLALGEGAAVSTEQRLLVHCGFRSGSSSVGTFVQGLHSACRFGETA